MRLIRSQDPNFSRTRLMASDMLDQVGTWWTLVEVGGGAVEQFCWSLVRSDAAVAAGTLSSAQLLRPHTAEDVARVLAVLRARLQRSYGVRGEQTPEERVLQAIEREFERPSSQSEWTERMFENRDQQHARGWPAIRMSSPRIDTWAIARFLWIAEQACPVEYQRMVDDHCDLAIGVYVELEHAFESAGYTASEYSKFLERLSVHQIWADRGVFLRWVDHYKTMQPLFARWASAQSDLREEWYAQVFRSSERFVARVHEATADGQTPNA
jgi:hypothetical protein